MFLINCPYCGERDQSEFTAGGEAHIVRPKQPTELSDDQWAEFLFMRKNNKQIIFITGTDTGVGKTTVTCKLLKKYLNQGYNIAALKPVASGCDIKNNVLINDDALCLKRVIDLAKNKNKKLNELSIEELKKIEPKLTTEVLKVFSVKYSVNSKKSYGGTSFDNIKKMIMKYKKL